MENLEKELEKLFCYCMGKEEIEISDIEAICTTQITNKIFDMVEAVAMKNQKKALDYYYDLLALKEPPMRILYLLTRQFKLLLEVKDLVGNATINHQSQRQSDFIRLWRENICSNAAHLKRKS